MLKAIERLIRTPLTVIGTPPVQAMPEIADKPRREHPNANANNKKRPQHRRKFRGSRDNKRAA